MLPQGTYAATARGGALTESQNKRTPQVVVEFEITSAEWAGERITWVGFLTDKTTERTIESLRYAGWKGTDLADLSDLLSKDTPVIELVIEHEEYEGKTRARVQWVNRIGGRMGAALPAEQAKQLSAKMRGAIAAVDAKLRGEGFTPPGAEKPPF